MYKATREFECDLPPELILDAVYDVASYPRFVKGVKEVQVERDDGRLAQAWFTAGLAGLDFRYQLEVVRGSDSVSWRRLAGSFRDTAGCVTHLGQGRFRYENALDPGFAVPGFAVRLVLERSLPRLIREFVGQARALQEREA